MDGFIHLVAVETQSNMERRITFFEMVQNRKRNNYLGMNGVFSPLPEKTKTGRIILHHLFKWLDLKALAKSGVFE